MTTKLIKKYLIPEMSNKLLIKLTEMRDPGLLIANNFKYSDTKFIKAIIAFELFSGRRPLVKMTLWKKTIIVDMRVNILLIHLSFLQKRPIAWNKYLDPKMNFNENFYSKPLYVKNNKLNLIINNQNPKKNNKLAILFNTAVLD